MTPVWIAILSPFLGFLGTILGIYIGQRRWKREQNADNSSQYQEKLREAYLELWDIVQDVHIEMRSAFGDEAEDKLSEFVAKTNNFMIRRGLYIERQDRYLVLEYLFYTHEFLRQISGTPEGRSALITSIPIADIPADVVLLGQVKIKAEDLRATNFANESETYGALGHSTMTQVARRYLRLILSTN